MTNQWVLIKTKEKSSGINALDIITQQDFNNLYKEIKRHTENIETDLFITIPMFKGTFRECNNKRDIMDQSKIQQKKQDDFYKTIRQVEIFLTPEKIKHQSKYADLLKYVESFLDFTKTTVRINNSDNVSLASIYNICDKMNIRCHQYSY